MQKLAKREEQIMQILWKLERAFVREIIEEFPEPKPHYNTIATLIRILKDKGFVDSRKFGSMYQFFPLISKENYQTEDLGDVLNKYFGNSYKDMVTYFAKEEKISESELEDILKLIKKK
jgi:BlaI family transcriptional regulator, penicillinase repressor